MKYINTKTSALIETCGTISGGDWKAVEDAAAPDPERAETANKKPPESAKKRQTKK